MAVPLAYAMMCGDSAALADQSQSLKSILEDFRKAHGLPALGAGILAASELVSLEVTGVRKAGDPTPASRDDLFHIGSCAKAMAAAVAGKLVERGTLHWTTTVAEALPWLPKRERERYGSVSVDHLIAHRGGLPEASWPPGMTFSDVHRLKGDVREQRRTYLQGILRREPIAAPGTRMAYSNAGYVLLAAMCETTAEKSWETITREEILGPLGMKSAGFGAMGRPDRVEQPWPHSWRGGPPPRSTPGAFHDNPPALNSAGRVHCSLADWSKFLRDQLAGAAGKPALLKAETYRRLTTPSFGGDYAGGWIVVERKWAGGRALTHAGSNTLNYAVAWLAPSKDFGVFVTTNAGGDGIGEKCDSLVFELIQRHLGSRK